MAMSEFSKMFKQKRGTIRKQRRAIKEVLTNGPALVSEIADKTELEKSQVVWNLVGMLRWGDIEIVDDNGEELIYGLKES
jgi:predicted transcriptional regulator